MTRLTHLPIAVLRCPVCEGGVRTRPFERTLWMVEPCARCRGRSRRAQWARLVAWLLLGVGLGALIAWGLG